MLTLETAGDMHRKPQSAGHKSSVDPKPSKTSEPAGSRALEGSELRHRHDARPLGKADEAERFKVTIVLRRRPGAPPIPDARHFLRTPPLERRRLSESEFAARYGAEPEEIERVADFAHRHGLTVDEANAARRTVIVSGTVRQFNASFNVELHNYEHEVRRSRRSEPRVEVYRSYDGFIHVPADLAEIIVGVFGLDNRRITKRNAADPPNTNPIPMTTMPSLYGFPSNLAAGQTIAIFSEGGFLASDIAANFPSNPPSVLSIAVDAPNGGYADGETTQDIFISASVAPGAQVAVYFTTYSQQGWVDLLARVIHPSPGDPICSVLSSSFYVSDGDDAASLLLEGIPTSWITAVSQIFEDAAIQNVTICIASGDTGAQSKLFDGKAHVQYPGSDPFVLAVGGTTIGNIVGTSCDEWAWNDNTGASGGGISDYFPQPGYQVDANVPVSVNDGHRGRGVPDVAANASPNSGYPFILNGLPGAIANGTSASAPLWAGLIAVLNAALGESVGFINPVIYALNGAGFRDIVAEPGAADNSFSGVHGYPVTVRWDAVTGWGSPRGLVLLTALKHFYGPAIAVSLQDDLDFGTVCEGPAYRVIRVYNVGNRDLMILDVARISGSTDFTVSPAPATPLAIAPGAQVDFTVVFKPSTRGVLEQATIEILSNDPVTPALPVQAEGSGGVGELVVTGSTIFGAVQACCRVERTISICNVGDCKLNVTSVAFKRKSRHWRLVNNPFPAHLQPGSCLGLVIRYVATERLPHPCGLIIESDDPAHPVKTLDVEAVTVWDDGCKKCCDDCRKQCCQTQQCGPCACHKCASECDEDEIEAEA